MFPSMKIFHRGEHIKYTENKITNSIGLMDKTKPFLEKGFLLLLHFLTLFHT